MHFVNMSVTLQIVERFKSDFISPEFQICPQKLIGTFENTYARMRSIFYKYLFLFCLWILNCHHLLLHPAMKRQFKKTFMKQIRQIDHMQKYGIF